MQTQSEQLIEGRYLLKGPARVRGTVELCDALDTQLDRAVTVQRLSEADSHDAQQTRTFLENQQLAASIHGCPLRAVYDAGVWNGRPFSVMQRDDGKLPGALYRPGYPPDVPAALRVTRQVADALCCCREAGLHDWTFSPDAVSIDAEGNGTLAILEGLGGPFSSFSEEEDAAALGALLRLMLLGNADTRYPGGDMALLPASVVALLDRMIRGKEGGLSTAGEVTRAIAALEEEAYRPTEAYEPSIIAAPPAVPENVGNTLPLHVVPLYAPDAPTLAAIAVPAALAAKPSLTPAAVPAPYVPPTSTEAQSKRRVGVLPLLAALGALLMLVMLLVAVVPRLRAQQTAGAASAAPVAPTPAPAVVAAPDLRGKSLDDARNIAGGAGLTLSEGDPVHDGTFAAGTVARQQPDPAVQLHAGSLITVSLSLGPEATATPQPQQSGGSKTEQSKTAPPPQPAPQKNPGKEKKNEHKKGKD